jgi:endonuclease/exonuclease/phosphatase family metal-dependent hydrolase
MRIVSWNLHGAAVPGRATNEQQHRAWRYMREDLRADLILAQEVSADGIPDDVRAEWSVVAGVKGRYRKDWNWGSVIAADPALGLRECSGAYDDVWLQQLYDLVVVGEIRILGSSTLSVASVHTAAMPAEDWLSQYVKTLTLTDLELASIRRPDCIERPYINDFAFHALERLFRGGRFFIAGDWNTCRKYPGGPNFFDRAEASAWMQCLDEPEEPTYFTRSGNAYQLDHAFCDPTTARSLTSAAAVANDLTKSLSDHVPIVIEVATSSPNHPKS